MLNRLPSIIITYSPVDVTVTAGCFSAAKATDEKKVSLTDLGKGIHYIDVWKKKKGLFGSKYKLVSSKQFELGKNDLHIDVNFSGYITIGKQGKGWDGDYWLRNGAKQATDDKDDF